MEQLDRLVWAAGLSFSAYGRQIGIRVSDPALLASLSPRLPFGWQPSAATEVERLYSLIDGSANHATGSVRRFTLLYGDATRLARELSLDPVLRVLEANLRLFVAEFAVDRVFIHAGVVAWHDRAILLPGRTFAGKSTLVAALVRAGARYYSDEYAVIDGRGRVQPFLSPLSLREGSESGEIPASMMGGKPLPVGLVVVTEYREGSHWQPARLSSGEGALALLDNAVAARREPEAVLTAVERVVSRAPVLRGERGEADETAELILKR